MRPRDHVVMEDDDREVRRDHLEIFLASANDLDRLIVVTPLSPDAGLHPPHGTR